MPSHKAIVVLIGNNGTLVSYHNGNEINSQFFSNNFDTDKVAIKDFFSRRTTPPVYILLDTAEQTYKKKSFPNIRRADIEKIARREMMSEADGDGFKNFIIVQNKILSGSGKSKNTKSECLFISASKSENINNWLDFLYELPNRFIGIYLLPVESFNLVKQIIFRKERSQGQKIPEDSIYCLIIQTAVGGIKQVVFSNSGIVFTRVVNYSFNDPNYHEKYHQDIFSTFEYLKRIYIDLNYKDFNVINILPQKNLDEIAQGLNQQIKTYNLSTSELEKLLNLKHLKSQDGESDLIINSIFLKSTKHLKFATPKLRNNESLIMIRNSCQFINFILLAIMAVAILISLLNKNAIYKKIEDEDFKRIESLKELNRIQKLSINKNFEKTIPELADQKELDKDKDSNIEKIFDMGRVEEALGETNNDFLKIYSKMSFLNNFSVSFKSFEYKLNNFDPRQKNPNPQKQVILIGKIVNQSGDIENLFTEFDKFMIDTKKNLTEHDVTHNELPRNIDFNQKYFEFPIELTINSKNPNASSPKVPNNPKLQISPNKAQSNIANPEMESNMMKSLNPSQNENIKN